MKKNSQAMIPPDRVHMPIEMAESDGLKYLSTEGLPPMCEWRFPRRGQFFSQHRVDFRIVNAPRQMAHILAGQDAPDWFLTSKKWDTLLAIGIWETTGPTGFKMNWHICISIYNGHVWRIETNPIYIRLSLKSNQDMAAAIEEKIRIEPVSKARSDCIVFINSSPRQMMVCLERYLLFVNGIIVTAEAFLEVIKQVDPAASESGTMWYLLVADYLQRDE
jgi:hypothetical protein